MKELVKCIEVDRMHRSINLKQFRDLAMCIRKLMLM